MAFMYRLEDEDGTPLEPHTFKTAVPNWKAGHTIPLPHRALRVVEVVDDDASGRPRGAVRLDVYRERAGGLWHVRQMHWGETWEGVRDSPTMSTRPSA